MHALKMLFRLLIGIVSAAVLFFIISSIIQYNRANSPAFRSAVEKWEREVIRREGGAIVNIDVSAAARHVHVHVNDEKWNRDTLNEQLLLIQRIRRDFRKICRDHRIVTARLFVSFGGQIYSRHYAIAKSYPHEGEFQRTDGCQVYRFRTRD